GWTFDATAYGPAQDTLRFGHPEDHDAGWLMGSRIAAGRILGAAFASLGVNAAGVRERAASTWATATGLGPEGRIGGNQVTGELTFRLPGAGLRAVHGLYLQDAIPLEPLTPLARGLYGVVRFEYFQPGTGTAEIGGLLGLYWRPVPSFVLRGD